MTDNQNNINNNMNSDGQQNSNNAPKRRSPTDNKEMLDLAKMMNEYKSAEDFTKKNDEVIAEKNAAVMPEVDPLAEQIEKQKKIARIILFSIAAIVCLSAALIFALISARNKVSVPQLVGLNIEQARDVVEKNSLVLEKVNYDPGSRETEGKVLRQEPNSNAVVQKGAGVILTVAGKPKANRFNDVEVPNRPSGTQNQVDVNPPRGTDNPNTTTNPSSSASSSSTNVLPTPEDGNTDQRERPSGGKQTQDNRQSSSGIVSEEVWVVPNYAGHDYDEIKRLLEANGINIGWYAEENSNYKRNQIIRSEPSAGSKIKKGDTIILVRAK